jgi:hypothetical protein
MFSWKFNQGKKQPECFDPQPIMKNPDYVKPIVQGMRGRSLMGKKKDLLSAA